MDEFSDKVFSLLYVIVYRAFLFLPYAKYL
jgi:hypothetical protein